MDQQSKPNIDLLIKQIELKPDLYSQYLRYFKIDVNQANLNFYDSLIINFLNLLLETNKLIFIDDVMQFIKPKDKVVIKQLINRLKKHNTVFLTGKEEYD
ncbi:MAG: hypothetical protein MJ195_02995 [Mycoplasmoidaceae bacterium]|nr:hypothetical protein [Mycoplasmoidaceae bacterium]